MATPDPTQVAPWYLRNINQALELNETTGQVFVRTNAQISGNIGNIVVGNVGINSLGNVDISGNTLPVSGNINATITNSNLQVTQGTNPWVVSGNVGISSMPEVEIKNDVGNPIPVTSNYEAFTVGFNPTQTDAFGRFRVSEPYTLFDSFHRFADNGSINTFTANGGTSGYNANAGVVTMNVTTASGSEVLRESSRVFSYQPGKSLLVLQTFVMAPAKPNLRQRYGYFDSNNGFYLQLDNSQLSLVKRSSSSGTTINTVVNQAEWNVDPMDGSGPSGITLDISKAQILWHDIEWLGVGTARAGFVINGQFYPVHYWNHANIVTTTYMTTACLPIRAEITNTGATASPSTLQVICTSIISEGGYEIRGRSGSIAHNLGSPINLDSGDGIVPLISIRLKSNRLNGIVLPTNFTVSPTASGVFKFYIYQQAITSGGTWASAGANSCVEYNLAPTAVTSGQIVEEGFIITSNQAALSPNLEEAPFKYQLERNSFTSTAYEFVIAVATTGTNQNVYSAVSWEEIT